MIINEIEKAFDEEMNPDGTPRRHTTPRIVHALDTTPDTERTMCGLPLSKDRILYTLEPSRVTCRTCTRAIK